MEALGGKQALVMAESLRSNDRSSRREARLPVSTGRQRGREERWSLAPALGVLHRAAPEQKADRSWRFGSCISGSTQYVRR
ncbi:hypothetical protein NDU88_004621 [Pleurodeles waltl]|uniref:Uncharacterized protein n=1 Tax=Pleurodeles waltl TaxID=8319 RepID=A0AAV7RGR5_PLEWA|nr:hypothetical protein NDU88_004621 [Pleurodeles waltl]